MRALVQRVCRAAVRIDGTVTAEIGVGLVVLLGVTNSDAQAQADVLARRVHELRILREEQSVATTPDASVLVVSQFTLYGDTRKGRRPSWLAAAPGPVAEPLVHRFCEVLRGRGASVATGRFGADMRVEIVNDGPVTLMLEA
jgi:D-tyrosyl-tRNA(Tyr) deacylase